MPQRFRPADSSALPLNPHRLLRASPLSASRIAAGESGEALRRRAEPRPASTILCTLRRFWIELGLNNHPHPCFGHDLKRCERVLARAMLLELSPDQAAKPLLISEGALHHQCEAHFNPSKKAGLHCSVPFRSGPPWHRGIFASYLLVRPSWNSRRAHAVMVRIGVS